MNIYDLLSTNALPGFNSVWGTKGAIRSYNNISRQPPKEDSAATFQSRLHNLRSKAGDSRLGTKDSAPSTDNVIYVRMPGKNWIYSQTVCGRTHMQDIYAEYTEDSTEEDPIAYISGTSDSGVFGFTCHINDIDPTNASYAEMVALYGHLSKSSTDEISPGSSKGTVVPTGMERGDVTKKKNFISQIRDHSISERFSSSIHTNARDLLQLYQKFMEKRTSESISSPK